MYCQNIVKKALIKELFPKINYLVEKENSLVRVKLVGLKPRFARKMKILLNGYGFQEQLIFITINNCNSSRSSKIRINAEFHFVTAYSLFTQL